MSESVHRHRESAPEPVRVAVLTISDTRTRETDTGGDTAEEILREAGQEIVARQIVGDEVNGIRTSLVDLLANPEVDAVITTGGTGISGRDTTYEVVDRMIEKKLDGFGEIFRMLSYEEIGAAAIMSRAVAGGVGTKFVASLPGSRNAVRLAVEKLLVPELAQSCSSFASTRKAGREMEREPLSSGGRCALAQAVGDLAGQRRGGRDPRLEKLADLEDEIPGLENRIEAALAYLQRARYISTAPASAMTV